MKLNFQSTVKVVPKWKDNHTLPEGEQFSLTIRTMTSDHLFEVMDTVSPLINDNGIIDPNKSNMKEVRTLLSGVSKVMPKYIDVHNLEDKEGAVNSDRIFTDPRLMNLAIEVLGAVITASSPTSDDEKN